MTSGLEKENIFYFYDNSRFELIPLTYVQDKYGIDYYSILDFVINNNLLHAGISSIEHLCILFLESQSDRFKIKISKSQKDILDFHRSIKITKEIIKKIKKEMKNEKVYNERNAESRRKSKRSYL